LLQSTWRIQATQVYVSDSAVRVGTPTARFPIDCPVGTLFARRGCSSQNTMDFDLAPDNRDQSDAVLLEDLRSVSTRLQVQKLTREAYASVGRFSPATVAARFGGWGLALEKAGLSPSRHFAVTRQQCIDDLQRVAKLFGRAGLTVSNYREHGQFSEKPFKRHFGSWAAALETADLDISEQFHRRIPDEELFENLEAAWQGLGRQPTVNDMFPPLSRFSAHAYKRRFGGFRKALEAFVAALPPPQPAPPDKEDVAAKSGRARPLPNAVGNRSVGWRLRYLVLKRDNFSCRACGRSPAREPGTVLQVDHIVPWARGGSTVESNLQTLCDRCNGGKGAA
jgi:hypothetical protein